MKQLIRSQRANILGHQPKLSAQMVINSTQKHCAILILNKKNKEQQPINQVVVFIKHKLSTFLNEGAEKNNTKV